MNRPYVTASVAMSLDGYIDDSSPQRLILSNEQDWHLIDKLRSEQDAILVGANTVRRDNPSLLIKSETLRQARIKSGRAPDLTKVTLTRSGDLNADLNFFQTGAAPKLVYAPAAICAALKSKLPAQVEVIATPGTEVSPQSILSDLFTRGVKNLLIEGGAEIHALFLGAGLVDELRVAIAPFFVSDPKAPKFTLPEPSTQRMMRLTSVETVGDMAVLKYRLN